MIGSNTDRARRGRGLFFEKNRARLDNDQCLEGPQGFEGVFLRVCQLHSAELLRHMEYTVNSRRLWSILKKQSPQDLTDIQRAARFIYLQRVSWGGKPTDQHYGCRLDNGFRFNATTIGDVIARTARRLERVQLENWPYEKVLERYDRPDTFFYCDPPYLSRPLYKFNFALEDFQTLADRLGRLRGKFLVSINDHPFVRTAFSRFTVRALDVVYTTGTTRRTHELVIANYPLTRTAIEAAPVQSSATMPPVPIAGQTWKDRSPRKLDTHVS